MLLFPIEYQRTSRKQYENYGLSCFQQSLQQSVLYIRQIRLVRLLLSPTLAPVLPLSPTGTIAVIGPLANTRSNMPGTWSVAAVLDKSPSLVEGLTEWVGNQGKILYAKGSNLIGDAAYEERATMFGRSLNRDNRTDQQLLDEALKIASQADVIVPHWVNRRR